MAASSLLSQVNYVPNLVFASSGGSICAFVMLASDWDCRKVSQVLENICSKMFVQEWNFPLLQKLYSLSQGSLFDKGSGGAELFARLFDSRKLQTIETWVGAYNKDLKKFKVMTNLSEGSCIMNVTWADTILHNLCSLDYATGDSYKMSAFVEASCSIPGIVPNKMIDGFNYVDGGVVCASPLSYFRRSLISYAQEKGITYHFTCNTCEDLNSKNAQIYSTTSDDSASDHLVQSMVNIVSSMINVSLVRDRVACNDVLNSLGSKLLGTVSFKATVSSLATLMEFKAKDASLTGSVVELFGENIRKYMDMANFDGETCITYMMEAEKNMVCRLWVYCGGEERSIGDIIKSSRLTALRRCAIYDNLPRMGSR